MMYSLMNGCNPRARTQIYNPINNPYANYCTEALQKSEMKLDYENEIILNNLHLFPDPLKKNLADTLITTEIPEKLNKQSLDTPKMPPKQPSTEDIRSESTLAGITNFFSGVFSMISGAVFRTQSPVNYYDCFDASSRQGSPPIWRASNSNDQDKNGTPADTLSSDANPVSISDMNKCKTVSSCENKLNQVKVLLAPKAKPSNSWRKRPKKVFVEPGSVEDSFEDAIAPEDFVTLPNDPYIECYSPSRYQADDLCETDTPKIKVNVGPIDETTKIIDVTECITSYSKVEQNTSDDGEIVTVESDKINEKETTDPSVDNHQLVSSCEDKLSKLKALLRDKRKKNTKVIPPSPEVPKQPSPPKSIPISKPVDKRFKNPNRMLDKRRKMKINRCIQDDAVFANEIDVDSPVENSPSTPSTITSSDTSLGDYFDELKGRFRCPSATESEDSFQIVFNDSPNCRRASDCESEDSFIVFEDTDNCYTSNDVFGDSDSDSDVSDSGCSTMTCKLSHSLSRTVSNLTDDTLYESGDEVDCAKVVPVEARGLLMDANKKNLRKDLPAKKVHFSSEPPVVKVMRVWAFAARQARVGHWERFALDRDRFKRRIADVDMAVSWVLKPQHRARVMFQRFMPWRNREKRRELAEKKEKEERAAEEQRIEEERRQKVENEKLEEKEIGQETGEDVNSNEGEKRHKEMIESEKTEEIDDVKRTEDSEGVSEENKTTEKSRNKNNQVRKRQDAGKRQNTNSTNDKTETKLSSLTANDAKEVSACDSDYKSENIYIINNEKYNNDSTDLKNNNSAEKFAVSSKLVKPIDCIGKITKTET